MTDAVGGSSTAGRKLKSTSGWDINGTDDFSFSVLMSSSLAGSGNWWSATKLDANLAWRRNMSFFDYVYRGYENESALFSVRCVEGVEAITLKRNTGEGYDDWQGFYSIPPSVREGNKITTGNKYTFTYSFKSYVTITGSLKIALVDNSATATPQWWSELSRYETIKTGIPANTVVSGAITINAVKTASSTAADANKLVFIVTPASGAAGEPTLTFTSFSFEKDK